MDKQQKRKDLILPIIICSIIVAIFIFAIWQFLGTKDCYGLMGGPQTCITGWETLKLEWPSFWTWVAICTIMGGVCLVVAIYNETGAGKLGRWLHGNQGLTWALLVLALLLFTCPWGKACTDKGNGGFTAPGHKVDTSKGAWLPPSNEEPITTLPFSTVHNDATPEGHHRHHGHLGMKVTGGKAGR